MLNHVLHLLGGAQHVDVYTLTLRHRGLTQDDGVTRYQITCPCTQQQQKLPTCIMQSVLLVRFITFTHHRQQRNGPIPADGTVCTVVSFISSVDAPTGVPHALLPL